MAKLQWLAKEKKTLWQAWLHRGRRVVIALALIVAFGLTSCGQSSDVSSQKSAPSVGSVATAPVPSEIAKLDRYMESYRPKVAIVSPRADEVLQDTQISVRFNVQDYPLFKDEELGLGPNLHVILDNKPYITHYDANSPLLLTDLEPGTHTLRVFAARPWHESFKNREAYAQTTFHVFTKTEEYAPQAQLPVLTYSSPSESYGAEPILLDLWLANAPIRESLVPDVPKDWRIRYTLNGKRSTLDRWQPIYLTGLKSGRNIVSVELVDGDGQPIRNVFNSAARAIDYHPGGTDTLSKLVRGVLKAEDALAIVGATPELEPELELEPEFTELELIEQEETEPLVSEPEQTSTTPDEEETQVEEREKEEPPKEAKSVSEPEVEEIEPDSDSEADETPNEVNEQELVAPTETAPAVELEIEPQPPVEDTEIEDIKIEATDEPEASEQASEPEINEPESPNEFDEVDSLEDISESKSSTVEPLTSPNSSRDRPTSISQGARSWWQKLRGQSEQDTNLKLEAEEKLSDEIPQTIAPTEASTDSDNELDSNPPESSESEGDRQFEDAVDAEIAEPADIETATSEEQATEAVEEGISEDVLDSDTTEADDSLDDTENLPEESVTETAPAATTERPLNFWQKFLRDRQPIPADNLELMPEVPAQLAVPEFKPEEEIEAPKEEFDKSEETLDTESTPESERSLDNQPAGELPSQASAQPEPIDSDVPADVEDSESNTEPRSFLQRFQQQRQQAPTSSPNVMQEESQESSTPASTGDESAEVEDAMPPIEEPSTPTQLETDRPRGFLEKLRQQQRQSSVQPRAEEEDSAAAETIVPDDDTGDIEAEADNGLSSEPSESSTMSADEQSTSQPSDSRGFLQRFQQRKQPAISPITPPESSAVPESSEQLTSTDTPQDSDIDTSDRPTSQPSESITPPEAQTSSPETDASTQPERPLGFLQKLRQQQRPVVSPSTTELPKTLTGDEQPTTEGTEQEPVQSDTTSFEDAPEVTSSIEAERSEQPDNDLEPAAQSDRPSGFLQRLQRRSQQLLQQSPQPSQFEEASEGAPAPATTTQPLDNQPSLPAEPPTETSVEPSPESPEATPYPFLEQLKRDREAPSTSSRQDTTTSPDATQQDTSTSDRLPADTQQSPKAPAQPSSPASSSPTVEQQLSQKTLRNFNPSLGKDSEQPPEITTVKKPRTPIKTGGNSLLPSSISDQPQRISIPPRL